MTGNARRTLHDDIRDAVEEDERTALIAELSRLGFLDDVEDWLGLAS